MTGATPCCFLFDLGKVLLDFDLSRLGERIEALTGVTPDQLRASVIAGDLASKYESGRMSDNEFHRELCGRICHDVPWDEFVAAWNSIFLPTPILRDELLVRLGSRIDLWIISNTNPIHFRFIREHYAFLRHFKGFILSHEVDALKPDRRIFARAVAVTGVEATRTLFVDDQEANVEAARSLGFQAFRFVDPEHFTEQLRALNLLE